MAEAAEPSSEDIRMLEQDLISAPFDNSNGSLGQVVQPYNSVWVDIEKREMHRFESRGCYC